MRSTISALCWRAFRDRRASRPGADEGERGRREQRQASLTAFSRTDRTAADHGVTAGHPAVRDLRFLDYGTLAGQGALVYGSEGWGFESLRARQVKGPSRAGRGLHCCQHCCQRVQFRSREAGQSRRRHPHEAVPARACRCSWSRRSPGCPDFHDRGRDRRPERGTSVAEIMQPQPVQACPVAQFIPRR